MVANPDMDAATKNAIQVQTNQAANSQYDAAQAGLDRYGRTTGNRAGNAAATAQLAMDRASTAANTNNQDLMNFQNYKLQRQQQGLAGLGSLYSASNQQLDSLGQQRAALDAGPVGGLNSTSGSGNYVGSNFGFSIG
jgi:hypothetical protein